MYKYMYNTWICTYQACFIETINCRYANLLKVLKKQSVIFLALISVTLSFLAMMILQYFALGFWFVNHTHFNTCFKSLKTCSNLYFNIIILNIITM